MPRWTLKLPDTVSHVHTVYVGVQSRSPDSEVSRKAEQEIASRLNSERNLNPAMDTFRVTNGFDLIDTKVWVVYHTQEEEFHSTLSRLNLRQIWSDLGSDKDHIGLWRESFSAPVQRLETNYARLDHKPGLAQLPGIEQPAHELTAYWGAGRDRIPDSAHDLFPTPDNVKRPDPPPKGLGQHLLGENYSNMCHIRSGQWWEQCDDEERAAYEHDLEPALMGGMRFLWEHPEETGTIGLRFMQNLNERDEPIRETCGAGFHRNWADLERWSSRHPSHLKIFNGAIGHAKRFGENRKFMTWHEVWILKQGDAKFEYVNCDPKTGVLKWVDMRAEDLL